MGCGDSVNIAASVESQAFFVESQPVNVPVLLNDIETSDGPLLHRAAHENRQRRHFRNIDPVRTCRRMVVLGHVLLLFLEQHCRYDQNRQVLMANAIQ